MIEFDTPADAIQADTTPSMRGPMTPADMEICRAATIRFVAMAEKTGDLQRWLLSLAHELAAGRVPNWPRERAAREADLRRRMVDLETFITAALP